MIPSSRSVILLQDTCHSIKISHANLLRSRVSLRHTITDVYHTRSRVCTAKAYGNVTYQDSAGM